MTEDELKRQFEERRPVLHALGEWVRAIILQELEKQLGSASAVEKFIYIPPKPRVKETDSFLEKALIRKKKEDPLSEITDQVGVRFVVLLLEDIHRIGGIIESLSWHWQKDRDHEQEKLTKPDYFAYQSDHYVIRTKAAVEFGGIAIPVDIPCEIQIRTILQHAYAEMAHKHDYKPSVQLPEEEQKRVRRALAKGSALIETTDGVFKEVKAHFTAYDESVTALLKRSAELYKGLTGVEGNYDTPLANLLADSYRSLLSSVKPDDLTAWVQQRNGFGDVLKAKRDESVFYRDPVVVLLGYLIAENTTTVPRLWPVDSSYLEDYYIALGISTTGLC